MIEDMREYFEYKDGKIFWKKDKGSRGKVGQRFGSFDGSRYWHGMFNGKMYREHQLVWALLYGVIPEYIDHVDGNGLNNCIENLREVTQSQNMMNSRLRKDSSTKKKNVTYDAARKKYRVEITVNGTKKRIGRFDDIELASLVAEEARDKYHKQFARSF
jgi:hypothetical protein